MHDYALYIGRFQPFHHGHLASVKFALSIANRLIFVIGGHQLAPSITDPWTALARKKMILSTLTKAEQKRIQFIFIRDRLYNEDLWKENVITEIQLAISNNSWIPRSSRGMTDSKIVIVGHVKDNTSYYLKIFPQWQFVETGNFSGINGTQFREHYFSNTKPSYHDIPSSVANILKTFRKTGLFKTLQKEYDFAQKKTQIQKMHQQNAFIFLMVGSYFLLTKRSNFPGKNLYSLPHLNSMSSRGLTAGSIMLDLDVTKYCVARQRFYLQKYDGLNKEGKEISFYRVPSFAIDIKKYSNTKNVWVLFDDFCLMENKIFADHYQIIRSIYK